MPRSTIVWLSGVPQNRQHPDLGAPGAAVGQDAGEAATEVVDMLERTPVVSVNFSCGYEIPA